MSPSPGGFLLFIRNQIGIGALDLPDDSPSIGWAYSVALEIVNQAICEVSPTMYTIAVYNLGADNLINYAEDFPPSTYFTDLRATLKINEFIAGVVANASDEATSASLVVPEQLKMLTLSDLQNLKTPYGRRYLDIAQKYGPAAWGLS